MLHENLLQYRKMLRLSQEEIAERLGVSRQAYAKWEAGSTTPELKYCRMLADLFEITLDALVEERDLRREGPPGKYVLGVVAVDENDCIHLTEKAMLLFGLRHGLHSSCYIRRKVCRNGCQKRNEPQNVNHTEKIGFSGKVNAEQFKVHAAYLFHYIAHRITELVGDCINIAENINFSYSFSCCFGKTVRMFNNSILHCVYVAAAYTKNIGERTLNNTVQTD